MSYCRTTKARNFQRAVTGKSRELDDVPADRERAVAKVGNEDLISAVEHPHHFEDEHVALYGRTNYECFALFAVAYTHCIIELHLQRHTVLSHGPPKDQSPSHARQEPLKPLRRTDAYHPPDVDNDSLGPLADEAIQYARVPAFTVSNIALWPQVLDQHDAHVLWPQRRQLIGMGLEQPPARALCVHAIDEVDVDLRFGCLRLQPPPVLSKSLAKGRSSRRELQVRDDQSWPRHGHGGMQIKKLVPKRRWAKTAAAIR